MTTNKPEAVAWSWDYRGRHMVTTDYNRALELAEPPYPTEVEPLIRLADYQRLQADHERLQAECEKLRKDAARYQWLRARWGRIAESYSGTDSDEVVAMELDPDGWDVDPESLDAAIDAAIQGDKP